MAMVKDGIWIPTVKQTTKPDCPTNCRVQNEFRTISVR